MKENDLREWKRDPATREAVKEAEERADEINQDILQLLASSDTSSRATYLAGVIYGLTLAFNPEVEEEDGEQ